ncbi:unnamed protein product [Prorocentrum cordatum]|uniref:Uncharacterized protein n=1 Tax=Prorocentrum cordatum TaxID=2364126 RepID=A0ABN9Q355_9DINO|nr:unnamed protein product [Polarella glacialis]
MADDSAPPQELDCAPGSALQLLGDGVRKIMGVLVYRIALYADAEEARRTLAAWDGHPHGSLCARQDFFDQLAAGRYRKCLRLHFAWGLGAARVQSGFGEALLRRVPEASAAHARALVASVPDVPANSVLLIRFAGDGEHVEPLAGQCLNSVASHELWSAFQRIYFDEQEDLPAIKRSLVRRVPQVVFPPPHDVPAANGTAPEGRGGLADSSPRPGQAELRQRRTWRDSSGRAEGKAGYKFGDVTRTLLQKTRTGGQAPAAAAGTGGNDTRSEHQHAIADLSAQVEGLQKDREEAAQRASQERLAVLRSGALAGASTALFAASAAVEVLGPTRARPLLLLSALVAAVGLPLTRAGPRVAELAASASA